METTQFDIVKEMYRLIDAANANNIQLRAIGGLAVQAHNRKNYPLLCLCANLAILILLLQKNSVVNLKLSCPRGNIALTSNSMSEWSGTSDLLSDNKTGMKVDIFVGDFEMCHKIPLEERLTFDPLTIPLGGVIPVQGADR